MTVQAGLSNGEISPFYASEYATNAQFETLEFEPNASIRSISVVSFEEDGGSVNALSFNDAAGVSIGVYNPRGYEFEDYDTKIELGENEQLVGIYGNMNQKRVGSFGFIVKSKAVRK